MERERNVTKHILLPRRPAAPVAPAAPEKPPHQKCLEEIAPQNHKPAVAAAAAVMGRSARKKLRGGERRRDGEDTGRRVAQCFQFLFFVPLRIRSLTSKNKRVKTHALIPLGALPNTAKV
jgi:hypothetical protein